jgi:hypothetical protein
VDRFIRLGTLAGAIGGVLLAAGAAVTLAFGQAWLADSTTVSSCLRLAGAMLITWGLIALYLRQADAAGRLGVLAVVACLINMMLQAGWMFADLFIAPSIESLSPGLLDGSTPPRLGVGFMLAWLANASFVLLAVATLRARVLPRTTGIAIAVAGAVTLIPLPVDGPAYEVLISLAFTTAALTAIPTSVSSQREAAPAHI